MSENKVYLIGFIGTDNFRRVNAKTVKEAKTLFAQYHRITISPQIVAKKWNADMMSKYIVHSDKLTIDWYSAERGYPYAEDKDQWKNFNEGVPA